MKFLIVSATLLLILSRTVTAHSDCDSKPYYQPHSTECRLFYQCSPNGTYVLHTCPYDLHFNPILNVCDFPAEAGCAKDHTDHPGDGETTSNPDPNTSTTAEAPEKCNIGEYLPHETECDAFYCCISGTFFLVYCPDGMQFNFTFNGCEVQQKDCNNKGEQSSTPTQTATTEITTENTNCTSTNSSADPNISTDSRTEATTEGETTTRQCINDEYKADEIDCEAFHRCINGRFIRLFCSVGSHFDPNSKLCVDPEVSGCNLEADQSTNSPVTTVTEISNSSTTNILTETQVPILECRDNEYRPDESDCEAFYRCINGRFVRLFCSIGTHFNSTNSLCVEPELAGCM